MSTPFAGPSGAGAGGPKRGTTGRGRTTRGGLNQFGRGGGSVRGSPNAASGARGGRGRGGGATPAGGSIRARRGIFHRISVLRRDRDDRDKRMLIGWTQVARLMLQGETDSKDLDQRPDRSGGCEDILPRHCKELGVRSRRLHFRTTLIAPGIQGVKILAAVVRSRLAPRTM